MISILSTVDIAAIRRKYRGNILTGMTMYVWIYVFMYVDMYVYVCMYAYVCV